MELFDDELFDDVGEGWPLTETFALRREIEGPSAVTSYQTPPARIVPCDLDLRWGLLVVASLDEAADEPLPLAHLVLLVLSELSAASRKRVRIDALSELSLRPTRYPPPTRITAGSAAFAWCLSRDARIQEALRFR